MYVTDNLLTHNISAIVVLKLACAHVMHQNEKVWKINAMNYSQKKKKKKKKPQEKNT